MLSEITTPSTVISSSSNFIMDSKDDNFLLIWLIGYKFCWSSRGVLLANILNTTSDEQSLSQAILEKSPIESESEMDMVPLLVTQLWP